MPTPAPLPRRAVADAAAYEALRKGGAPPLVAQIQLEMPAKTGARMENLFKTRALRGDGDSALPKFARHAGHIASVMAQGGFPAFSERRQGRSGVYVCGPLIYPAPAKDLPNDQ